MFVIGLTGGIGTGKTEVARILNELGAETISADRVAHETYHRGTPGWREVVEEFGDGVLTEEGEVDRGKLGALVFEDEQALRRLNDIVHPRTRSVIEERLQALQQLGIEVVCVEVPLLVEAIRREVRWLSLLDDVWVTVAPEDKVIGRIHARDRLGTAAIRGRIDSQIPDADRIEHAGAVIDNNGTLEDLRKRVLALWRDRVPLSKKDMG